MSRLGLKMADIQSTINDAASAVTESLQKTLGKYTSSFGAAPTSFSPDSSKYDVGSLSYPNDLFATDDNRYGGHYVIFYINVLEDSKLIRENIVGTVETSVDEILRSAITQIGLDAANSTVASAGLLGGGSTILGALGGGGGGKTGIAGALWGGAAAAIVAAAAGGKMSRQTKRLKTAIALHVPNTLSVRYSTGWGEDDTAAFQAAAMLSEGGMKALTEAVSSGTVNTQSLTGPAASIATSIALGTPGIGGALSAASGLAPNPKKEQLFKGVDFRTFTFEYTFSPRSQKELDNVNRIINTFKLHMHPEFKDASSFIFLYPSEFDIKYFHNNEENPYLHRHTSCVLKDMNINYAPNGAFTSFENGAPTQVNVQMTFVELAILTKDQILQGY